MSEVGRNVKKIRAKKNISQNKLARMAGISQPALSAIESGANNPSAVTVELLAGALEVSTAELLGEETAEDAFTAAEISMIRTYRALSAQGQEYVRQQLAIAYKLYAGEPVSVPGVAK